MGLIGEMWPSRHPGPTRLEPEQPAAGRGNTNRAAAVVGPGHGHNTCRHGRCSAARGATWRMRQMPGIARGAVDARLGHPLGAQLRCIGLADHVDARGQKALRDLGVFGRPKIGARQGSTPVGATHPGIVLEQILEQKRHAGEYVIDRGAIDRGAVDGGGGTVGGDVVHAGHDAVDRRIDRVGARKGRCQKRVRIGIAAGNRLGQAQGVVADIIVEVHTIRRRREELTGRD